MDTSSDLEENNVLKEKYKSVHKKKEKFELYLVKIIKNPQEFCYEWIYLI